MSEPKKTATSTASTDCPTTRYSLKDQIPRIRLDDEAIGEIPIGNDEVRWDDVMDQRGPPKVPQCDSGSESSFVAAPSVLSLGQDSIMTSPSSGGSAKDVPPDEHRAAIRGNGVLLGEIKSTSGGPATDVTDHGEGLYRQSHPINWLSNSAKVRQRLAGKDKRLSELLKKEFLYTHDINANRCSLQPILPRSQLDILVNKQTVSQELEACLDQDTDPAEIDRLVQRICHEEDISDEAGKPKIKSSKKIFALLAWIGQTEAIVDFLNEDISDLDLPLQPQEARLRGIPEDLQSSRSPNRVLLCLRERESHFIRHLLSDQWSFLSPFFTKGDRKEPHHFILPPQTVLPYTYEDNQGPCRKPRSGGESNVFKVHIHPDHHDFHDSKRSKQYFAVRNLKSESKVAFSNEVKTLKKFSGDIHPHLISLLVTYEQDNRFFLIFRWAECDLEAFWEGNTDKCSSIDIVRWMTDQCFGLADGLRRIHEYQDTLVGGDIQCGRHGDIKPQNILLFRSENDNNQYGILKLADFGLAEFHSIDTVSKERRSRIGNSLEYRPPECDVPSNPIGRSYDIWSLGCVYLEFITWAFAGFYSYRAFRKSRLSKDPVIPCNVSNFFDVHDGEPRVKPEVKDHFKGLGKVVSESHIPSKANDWLKLIEEDMLIVESPKVKRIRASQLILNLAAMR